MPMPTLTFLVSGPPPTSPGSSDLVRRPLPQRRWRWVLPMRSNQLVVDNRGQLRTEPREVVDGLGYRIVGHVVGGRLVRSGR